MKTCFIPKAAFIFIIAFIALSFYSKAQSNKNNFEADSKKLESALQYIDLYYVDTVNNNKLVETAIVNMLKQLDPHSVYMSKEEMKETNEPLQGNFEGIGVQFSIVNDTIMVVTPTPGGPSEKLGIQAGDRIIKINGVDATGSTINNNWVIKHLRGDKGTKVGVSILRKGKKDLIDYTITRDKIPINSIDATFMATDNIGYIKLNRFGATTIDEFDASITTLKSSGMKSLILDLRGNGGGYLQTAVDLADEFLGKNKLVVYTEGNNSPKVSYNATSKGNFEKGKLVVLIDEASASASEIVSGAIQDWDRGLIMGRRSFGKGLVQKPFLLADGSCIRLTTAKYFTPTGRCIQKPYNEGTDKYFKDLTERYKHGESFHPDSIKFPDSLKFYTPKKRLVYGGGGIMPDFFIPADTSKISDYYSSIIRKGLMYQYCLQYIDKKRDSLKNIYSDATTFVKGFKINDAFLNAFVAFAEADSVKKDVAGIELSKEYITNQLKANIGRGLFDTGTYDTYYLISSEIDDVYQEAIKAIEDKTVFKKYKVD
jgi:carboxyl-terminal processing protease